MTRRFFYTDPLAAAWMMKHFKLRIHTGGGDTCDFRADFSGNYYEEDLLSLGGKLYIHPDSLCLLEPQDGDVLYHNAETRIDRFAAIVGSVWLYDVPRAKRGVNNGLRIIQRNGIPFMWPESEVE
jgi:hypothetical protein